MAQLVPHGSTPKPSINQAWWSTPVIPEFGKWRQEGQEPEAILDYTEFRPTWAT